MGFLLTIDCLNDIIGALRDSYLPNQNSLICIKRIETVQIPNNPIERKHYARPK
jgi:hypothetical protein